MKRIVLALAVFVLSLSLGLYGSQNFVSQNQLAGLASLTSTSLFDDYDDLSYIDPASLINVTHDTQSAQKAITYTAPAPTTGGELDPAGVAGLMGWWRFDEGSGTVAADSSGNNHAGVVSGSAVWTTGKVNSALDFNGGYVDLGSDASLNAPPSFTIAAWVKRLNTGLSGTIFTFGWSPKPWDFDISYNNKLSFCEIGTGCVLRKHLDHG